ncbi:MAG: hypothetical protein AAF529_24650 [Pseudomonadota bacterium]
MLNKFDNKNSSTEMTSQHQTDTDNEVPPVARVLGLAVSEWVTYSFILLCVVATIFGYIVGGERDAQAERAMETLAALTEAAEAQVATGHALVCDATMLEPEQLANEYLNLSIRQAPVDEEDRSRGYGPALHIHVVEKEVSGDTWDTAQRLMALVMEAGEKEAEAKEARSERLLAAGSAPPDDDTESEQSKKPKNRLRHVGKKVIAGEAEYLRFSILASETALCS